MVIITDKDILAEFVKVLYHVGDQILLPPRRLFLANQRSALSKITATMTTDFVTPSDKSSENFISYDLHTFHSLATFIGEEQGRKIGSSRRTFIYDPLDGTGIYSGKIQQILELARDLYDGSYSAIRDYRNSRKVRVKESDFTKYTTHLTHLFAANDSKEDVIVKEDATVDAAYAAERKELFCAIKGNGTYYKNVATNHIEQLDRRNTSLDHIIFANTPLSAMEILLADATLPSLLHHDYLGRYQQLIDAMGTLFTAPRRLGYTSAVYECIATVLPDNHPDKTDLYFNPHLFLWDVPALLLREAGGEVFTIREEKGNYEIFPFSYNAFGIQDRKSEKYKEPFAVIVGQEDLVRKVVAELQALLYRD